MRIATRGSELALWQARRVGDLLVGADSCEAYEIVVVETSGDRDKTSPLHSIGGKGVFVKEIQHAVLDNRADIAVHSAKDMPAISPDELSLGAVIQRGDPRDALVGSTLADLGEGAVVATGSVRRQAQLRALRPDLAFAELRGNIATRLAKAGDFDAIVVAMAALERLDLHPSVVDPVDVESMIPQVGQGAVAVEYRTGDLGDKMRLRMINDPATRTLFDVERGFLRELGGDCSMPAAAHARSDGAQVVLAGFLATDDLARHAQLEVRGAADAELGVALVDQLRQQLHKQ